MNFEGFEKPDYHVKNTKDIRGKADRRLPRSQAVHAESLHGHHRWEGMSVSAARLVVASGGDHSLRDPVVHGSINTYPASTEAFLENKITFQRSLVSRESVLNNFAAALV